MGRTRKPCPGCGEVCAFRPANEVCGECKLLIKAGKLLRQQQERKFGRQYQVPGAYHSLPYILNCESATRRRFQSAFLDLCIAVSVTPAREKHTTEALIPGCSTSYSMTGSVYVESATRDSLRELYDAVLAIAKEAYSEGKEDGEHFVRGLCSGDVSLADLNKSTIGEP